MRTLFIINTQSVDSDEASGAALTWNAKLDELIDGHLSAELRYRNNVDTEHLIYQVSIPDYVLPGIEVADMTPDQKDLLHQWVEDLAFGGSQPDGALIGRLVTIGTTSPGGEARRTTKE